MAKTARKTAVAVKAAQYRIRFVLDPDAEFEECNGEARPLTREEYAEHSYRCCPDHPRGGTTVLDFGPPQIQGCAACGRTDYRDATYEEYRAYYGNPDRHVYLQSEVQRICPCCTVASTVGGTGYIDLMDDAPELAQMDRWFAEGEIEELVGYLREIAREDLADAKEQGE